MKRDLASRISSADLRDYLSRKLSSTEIGEIYGVQRDYVTKCLPKRPPRPQRKVLMQARKEYRDWVAQQVINKEITVAEAAKKANCSIRDMYRRLRRLRNA